MKSTVPTHPSRGQALPSTDRFRDRHLDHPDHVAEMLRAVGYESLEALVDETIPSPIRTDRPLDLEAGRTEAEVLAELRNYASRIRVGRSFLGMGYYGTRLPAVIQRNVLEDPGWYTQYTPYQAEISQGRLEALLNFQTMVSELSGLPLANSSLLDEATAAAEAMTMAWSKLRKKRQRFLVGENCHPQTLAVMQTRARPLGIEVETAAPSDLVVGGEDVFGVFLQLPATDGELYDLTSIAEAAHEGGAQVIVATDPLALVLMQPPGEMGADIVVGSSQRFGVPMGFGGPHAAFLTAREEYTRLLPGRVIGVSKDSAGDPALRLAMQTREQHIRRDKATSNICTAQVLLAVLASMYAVYHGPEGLRRIAGRVHRATRALAAGLQRGGNQIRHDHFFDTLRVKASDASTVLERAREHGFYLRRYDDGDLGIALDETVSQSDLETLLSCFGAEAGDLVDELEEAVDELDPTWRRESPPLEHEIFRLYHTEHEFLRYVHRLQSRELSLATSMIPLGSCTMKLNATTEMIPVTWPEFSQVHPFAPAEDTVGYRELIADLEVKLAEITGYPSVSMQPNAGAQGEYTGLLTIRAFHESRGEAGRDVCLIPISAHGTNPASAVLAGMRVVTIACDDAGNIDMEDLRAKAADHAEKLSAMMITYPSTHGVFERTIKEICNVVHEHGGQVYMDGANMNAQVGLARPGEMGADVVHLNLHKTFAIPHGGGGPGMGPIGLAEHLAPFAPGHPVVECGGSQASGTVSAAPWGSPSILPISWSYIRMMGGEGLTRASQIAILNANYMAHRLGEHYDILYSGKNGRVAHEFILDVRPFKDSAGVTVDDFAKRLMDYGFHAPTMSWPVAGTLMVEPTESESKAELDRYCDALISIREEIQAIEEGRADREDNLLKNAPHTVREVSRDDWPHPYTRQEAAFPAPWLLGYKFWPAVGRVDNAYGDRNLVCTCPPLEDYA